MAESKYAKYIITETGPEPRVREKAERLSDKMTYLLHLDGDVVKGASWVNCIWFWKGFDEALVEAHEHPYDEVLTFFGTNPEDPHDLAGEIEFWMGDEKYILTKTCMVFVPKGLRHCPLIIRRVDRPIFHFSTGHTTKYS
jgi:hypothetical protein